MLALRFIPNRLSTARYLVASLGLMVIVSLSIVTFVYLNVTSTAATSMANIVIHARTTQLQQTTFTPVTNYLDQASAFIQSNVPFFLMV
ncbi:MAG TPA: hypothetical protein VFD46_14040, partial [Chryseolinea sp.]|nr:hypothetical protein [Chryseolinea sp.]